MIEGQAIVILYLPSYYLVYGKPLEMLPKSLMMGCVGALVITTISWAVNDQIRKKINESIKKNRMEP
jgi:cytochrome bd-type quinol oxidase subunit 1